jgi:hypothetical protein
MGGRITGAIGTVSVSVAEEARGPSHGGAHLDVKGHEGTSVSQAPLRAVQDHPPEGRGPDHL